MFALLLSCLLLPAATAAATGSWTDWTNWSSCSKQCGGGSQWRSRYCRGGVDCVGQLRLERPCNGHACVGSWSPWQAWLACSVTCGPGGWRVRKRACPGIHDCLPVNGGSEKKPCDFKACPAKITNGEWLPWSAWGQCSVTCGIGGVQERSRKCPVNRLCVPPHLDNERRPCTNVKLCNPSWQDWSAWSSCSKTCGGGTQRRSRRCAGGSPPFLTSKCPGSDSDERVCNPTQCQFAWAQWAAWGACVPNACGVQAGRRVRQRTCAAGDRCPGMSEESQACTTTAKPKTSLQCAQDRSGEWAAWQVWQLCTRSCGGGTRRRLRVCAKPPCAGRIDESEQCNVEKCATWNEWTQWTACNKNCGTGQRKRSRACTGVGKCVGAPAAGEQSQACNAKPCPGLLDQLLAGGAKPPKLTASPAAGGKNLLSDVSLSDTNQLLNQGIEMLTKLFTNPGNIVKGLFGGGGGGLNILQGFEFGNIFKMLPDLFGSFLSGPKGATGALSNLFGGLTSGQGAAGPLTVVERKALKEALSPLDG